MYLYPFSYLLGRRAPSLVLHQAIRRIGTASSSEQNTVLLCNSFTGIIHVCLSSTDTVWVTVGSTIHSIFFSTLLRNLMFGLMNIGIKSENIDIKAKCHQTGVLLRSIRDWVHNWTCHIK